MFNNPYMPNAYNPQATLDRINNQMNELDKIRQQVQQQTIQPQTPTNLTQNFQIAPTNREVIKYATSIDEVQRDMVIGDTPYFSKDMSVVWIKNTKGDIKTYELTEIVPKDEKDLQIEYLQSQIEELKKGMVVNEQPTTNVIQPEITTNTTRDDESVGESIKENKSSSIQRVSTSKKK